MPDCFSLPNAAEVVDFLRGEAKELSMLANGKAECNALWKAADVIEQLLADRERLITLLKHFCRDICSLCVNASCANDDNCAASDYDCSTCEKQKCPCLCCGKEHENFTWNGGTE